MAEFYRKVNEEKSYHRAFFLAVSLLVAGVCSVYPIACFKKYSSKERAKLKEGVEELDRVKKEVLTGRRRSRHRSLSPPRRVSTHHHHQRRSSATTPSRYASPSNRYNRELRRSQREIEMERSPRPYHRAGRKEEVPNRARTERHGGYPRRQQGTSWEEVLRPI